MENTLRDFKIRSRQTRPTDMAVALNKVEQDPIYKVVRGRASLNSPGRDYTGIQTNFVFKTDTPIKIFRLEFLGPHEDVKQQELNYHVYIEIYQKMDYNSFTETKLYGDVFALEGHKGHNLVIDVPSTYVPEGKWTWISFQLDGPMTKTLRLEDVAVTEVPVVGGGNKVKIQCLVGSSQLAEIHFTIAE